MIDNHFFSWVPTVSGRLSYTIIGQTGWPRKCIHINNLGDGQGGKAIFFQERFCDDFIFPVLGNSGWLRSVIFRFLSRFKVGGRITGQHYFIAVVDEVTVDEVTAVYDGAAKHASLDVIHGRVYPILAEPIGRSAAEDVRSSILETLTLENGLQPVRLSELVSTMARRAEGVSPVTIGFTIRRDGITELWPTSIHPVPGQKIVFKDIGAHVPDYVEQSFFFIRDIAHTHQHHDPASDTIVRVHRTKDSFKKSIYFDLFRSIIKFKRERSAENIMSASGILAYAKSFAGLPGVSDEVPTDYQVENLKMSLDAAQFKLDHDAQRSSNRIALTLTTVFAIFGAIVSISSLAQFADPKRRSVIVPSDLLVDTTSWIAQNPIFAFVLSVVTAFFTLLAFGQIKPNRFRRFEDSQRLLIHFSKGRHVFILFTFSLLLFAISTCSFVNVLR